MQPDRQIELRHRREHRLEDRIVERPPGVRRVDLDAAGAEILDRAPRLRDRALHVLQRHRGDEGRKPLRMLAAQLRHRVIGDPRQRQPELAVGDVLDRRIGQRDDLAIVAELIHLAKARVEIEQLGHLLQPLAHVLEIGRGLGHLLEIALREDVAEDVDDGRAGITHPTSPVCFNAKPSRRKVEALPASPSDLGGVDRQQLRDGLARAAAEAGDSVGERSGSRAEVFSGRRDALVGAVDAVAVVHEPERDP